jgi:beta-glucosidase
MFIELPPEVLEKLGDMFADPLKDTKDTAYKSMVNKVRTYLPGAAGFSAEFPELGITSQVLTDGPAGLRIQPKRKGTDKTYYCTAWPVATLLASTWDTDLVHRVGQSMGNEVKEYGSDVLLGPALNIHRDPLCGRNFEYYSEDPLVSGKMAAAMVKGIQSNGVGTSIKHFAANNSETNRLTVNTMVSQRALREIYLRGFEITVKESQPWTVMSSYNKINGTYTSESNDLLTKILRNDWGFKGYVMTDWTGGSDVIAQMLAGNDMIMPGEPIQIQQLVDAVKSGKLDEKVLDKNIARILEIMLISPRYNKYKISNSPDLKANAAVARQAATDGMILLKNEKNALPISKSVKSIAAFGTTSYEFISGGTGSGDVNEAYTISLMDGLTNGGYVPVAELASAYQAYIKGTRAKQGKPKNPFVAFMGGMEPVEEMKLSPELATKMADEADLALITIGRNAGEGLDRIDSAGDFRFTVTENELIKNVSQAFHAKNKKVIVVLNIAGITEISGWRDMADAILLVWLPGQEAGNSVIDVLSGKVNPSGKLPVTVPMLYSDEPTVKNFPGHAPESAGAIDTKKDGSGFSFMQRTPWEITYEEGIYVGYRYFNTAKIPIAYEFGYGLSYTNFAISNLKLSSKNFTDKLTVTVDVKNTGKVAGKEVVQLYLGAPAKKLDKPESELKGFEKTKLLQPGESQTLTFVLDKRSLASFSSSTSSWDAEAGTYTVKIGASSKDIKVKDAFELNKLLSVEKVSVALAPAEKINELKIEK